MDDQLGGPLVEHFEYAHVHLDRVGLVVGEQNLVEVKRLRGALAKKLHELEVVGQIEFLLFYFGEPASDFIEVDEASPEGNA